MIDKQLIEAIALALHNQHTGLTLDMPTWFTKHLSYRKPYVLHANVALEAYNEYHKEKEHVEVATLLQIRSVLELMENAKYYRDGIKIIREALDKRFSKIRYCPPAYAVGAEPQKNVKVRE